MVKVTLVFSVLLIALGFAGYLGTGSSHSTALIPAWIGVALGFGGLLAISPYESRRKLFMHINVTIGLVGFLGGAVEVVRTFVRGSIIDETAMAALTSKLALTALLLIYLLLCVRSFIAARRTGKV
jgi:VanZ family protein